MWQGARAVLQRAVRGFTRDRGLGLDAVYRRITGMSFDAQTQTVTPTYEDTSLRVITGQLTNKGRGSAEISLGEATRFFTLVQTDLGDVPKPGDLIILNSATYRVRSIVRDVLGVRYRIETELV